MFIEEFANGDLVATKEALEGFLGSLETENEFEFSFGTRELPTGVPSHFLDIYPKGIVEKYDSFGLIYVRLWLVGNPVKLLSGIFLGAARAEQAQPRRAATYVRSRIEEIIDPLERQNGYQYKTWGDADIWWREPDMSVRAVTRQLEQFITYKAAELTKENVVSTEADVARLIAAVDEAMKKLSPIREFGKDILLIYFGENLPSDPSGQSPQFDDDNDTPMPSQPDINWFSTTPPEPDLGDLKGMGEPYRRMVSALAAGKHVLLLGAPGVGKTELAEAMCKLIRQPYDIVTATSDWTSVHTMGGYMPIPQADIVGEPLDFVPGVFTEAMAANKWLIIDEMNRADIDKAFGEMFTLLGGKRKSVALPYRKRQDDGSYQRVVLGQPNSENPDQHLYRLDPSWRMIGTMNTFDKASLFQMSYAFSRRVAVIEIDIPDEATFVEILQTGSASLAQESSTSSNLHGAVMEILCLLFAASSASGLGKLGLRVGPAIPLDIIKFVSQMQRFESDPVKLVLIGLELYLYPQFEGRHEETNDIASAIAASLGLAELPSQSLSRLRTFTGALD